MIQALFLNGTTMIYKEISNVPREGDEVFVHSGLDCIRGKVEHVGWCYEDFSEIVDIVVGKRGDE